MYRKIKTDNYQNISQMYHVSELLGKIVDSFGYSNDEISSFFHPIEKFVLDEKVFQPLKETLYRIKQDKKKVFIFGDYDCDGICATTIAVMMLKKLSIDYGFYIPDRIKEGYGLNSDRLQQSYQKGYQVLFTVDNGVSQNQQLRWAKEHQMTVIVCDHHKISQKLDCDCFLHPDLLDSPYHNLSAAATLYLLCKYLGVDDDKIKILAMLSILSDVMSLKGINIKIVKEGLALLNQKKYLNLLFLDKFELPLNEDDVSFKIIPKINSIGRLADYGNANRVVDFLLEENEKNIVSYCNQINYVNSLRISMSQKQYQLVLKQVDTADNFNFVFINDLHEGLLGLIANKLLSYSGKTSFVLTKSDNVVKCSARSNDDSLMAILLQYKDNFIHFGGHDKACGFTINEECIEPLKQFLDNKLTDCINEIIYPYIELQENDLTLKNCQEVFSYRPFGQDRKLPLVKLSFSNIKDYRKLKTDNQLKWTLDSSIEIISFDNKGYDYYLDKDYLTVIGQLKENRFRNKISYQIICNTIF